MLSGGDDPGQRRGPSLHSSPTRLDKGAWEADLILCCHSEGRALSPQHPVFLMRSNSCKLAWTSEIAQITTVSRARILWPGRCPGDCIVSTWRACADGCGAVLGALCRG